VNENLENAGDGQGEEADDKNMEDEPGDDKGMNNKPRRTRGK